MIKFGQSLIQTLQYGGNRETTMAIHAPGRLTHLFCRILYRILYKKARDSVLSRGFVRTLI